MFSIGAFMLELESRQLDEKHPVLNELKITIDNYRITPTIAFHNKTGRVIALLYYDQLRYEFYTILDDQTFRDIKSIIDYVTNKYIVSDSWWM